MRNTEFFLTPEQEAKLQPWIEEQDKKCAEQQGNPGGRPNYGAIGGAYTYSFSPTSLGVVVTVKNSVTNESIDLSDYDDW
eukprot:m.430566 g.430566  ORF g.430566 m.430566 type:complete len:80 (+) comp21397_c1_seq2:280-519(+)